MTSDTSIELQSVIFRGIGFSDPQAFAAQSLIVIRLHQTEIQWHQLTKSLPSIDNMQTLIWLYSKYVT
ncbi:hypothetical protein BLNAU_14780 [Blattamonas nauphoetae]|uniref:Uncharacterized protein n=1 Tax=Blattamonas nauphoetae TaxID=2049346 RepID=A0ABQ9XCS0_9EUKA|nr:hypothetical protein BLNAU_14780 [Blattamonas nauphoetae]